ncbi:MAG: HAD family hydrolase [Bacteroidetes bacterium]|nr:MAG: HAD family hydrolase [Bacteroidota bacterium]REJ99878.1 MAG: HAD family hydrolase [Bacteroidota bacterium]REK34251.1 MAG: HAD family hydrolase [Bacteroidota bacterium]REK50581.1 MAG: HAD family hydrolase [Bacteroidota bacterium]
MTSEKIKVVFLDRDGVINKERGEFTWQLEDFTINPGLIEALKELSALGYQFIVISNQSGIARGLYSMEQVEYLHLHLERYLESNGIKLLEIYYCPHHPDFGKCLCRKPGSLMLEKAIARFNVDLSQSCFVGDAERDREAALKLGLKAILIASNSSLTSVIPQISNK